MAPGLMRWGVIVGIACAALAVATLPPNAPSVSFGEMRRGDTPERIRALELRQELLTAQETLRRRRWVDSLTALTAGAADLPGRVVVGAPMENSAGSPMAEQLDLLAADARAEMDRLEIERPAVDVGLFLLEHKSGVTDVVVGTSALQRVEWYAGETAGRPYCFAARVTSGADWSNLRARAWTTEAGIKNVLGPCGWFARYGMPGASIHRWLEDAGASLSLARGPRTFDMYPVPEWSYFRMRSSIEWGDLRIEACLKRSADCSLVLLGENPVWARDNMQQIENALVAGGIPILESRFDYGGSNDVTGYILDDLEREFGPVAFARFWRSTRPVPDAFQEAFGVALDSWALTWSRSLEGAAGDVSVMPGGRESLLMLFYSLVGAVLAVGVVSRRRIG